MGEWGVCAGRARYPSPRARTRRQETEVTMTGFETYEFLESAAAADPGPAARARLKSDAADRATELAEAREIAERQAQRQEQAEMLALQNRALGDPIGELSRARAAAGQVQDRIADLESQLERERAKLSRAQSNIEFFAVRSQAVSDAVSRSAPMDGIEGAIFRAQAAHREYVAASRRAWADAQAGTAWRERPFVSRGGAAVRSEPVTCPGCIAVGATPEQSFWIHHSDADGNPLSATAEPVPVPPDDTDRRTSAGYGREIVR
jgi:hypothetical protein